MKAREFLMEWILSHITESVILSELAIILLEFVVLIVIPPYYDPRQFYGTGETPEYMARTMNYFKLLALGAINIALNIVLFGIIHQILKLFGIRTIDILFEDAFLFLVNIIVFIFLFYTENLHKREIQ
jgi:hypothetical protein